jgi:hypothetical protein
LIVNGLRIMFYLDSEMESDCFSVLVKGYKAPSSSVAIYVPRLSEKDKY